MKRIRRPFAAIRGVIILAAFMAVILGDAMASECIRCHTDKNKLKTITDGIPQKAKSDQISGKG